MKLSSHRKILKKAYDLLECLSESSCLTVCGLTNSAIVAQLSYFQKMDLGNLIIEALKTSREWIWKIVGGWGCKLQCFVLIIF